MNNIKKISIIGAGAWGCGIAQLIANNGNEVLMFTNDPKITKDINNKNLCVAFCEIKLSTKISANDDLSAVVDGAKFIFIVVPSGVFLSVMQKIIKDISADAILIVCSKGIDSTNLQLFSQTIEDLLPKANYAILSGPNFAKQVAQGLPSTASIASKNQDVANKVVNLLKNQKFLPIANNDVISTQIFGAVKNILAIGCGMVDGLNLGENTKAALILKGAKEMNLLIDKLDGKLDNFISPAGLGDLFLTCSSATSRNNQLGLLIGSGKKIDEILSDEDKVYEGFAAAKAIIALAKKHNVNLPLCEVINKILQNPLEKEDIKNSISGAVLIG
jgi:glycerol-3-phosphate dehydrogenase (NAD(P)+)